MVRTEIETRATMRREAEYGDPDAIALYARYAGGYHVGRSVAGRFGLDRVNEYAEAYRTIKNAQAAQEPSTPQELGFGATDTDPLSQNKQTDLFAITNKQLTRNAVRDLFTNRK